MLGAEPRQRPDVQGPLGPAATVELDCPAASAHTDVGAASPGRVACLRTHQAEAERTPVCTENAVDAAWGPALRLRPGVLASSASLTGMTRQAAVLMAGPESSPGRLHQLCVPGPHWAESRVTWLRRRRGFLSTSAYP